MTAAWLPWPPPDTCRCLVTREVNGLRYVDAIVYSHEPESGLPPYPSQLGCTHWMPMPQPAGLTAEADFHHGHREAVRDAG